VIADCQLPIFDWRLAIEANWQSAIANRKSGDPPACEVVLTSSPRGSVAAADKLLSLVYYLDPGL
jgi:hypothetical protein